MISEKKEILEDILLKEQRGNKPSGGRGNKPSGGGGGTGKSGGSGNTGGNTGGSGTGGTPAPKQDPKPESAPAPKEQPTITRQEPLPEPGPKKDVNFCKCWTEGNYFEEDFLKEERNSMANKFYSYASRQKISKGTFDRVEANVASKNCGDSNCLFYQNPTIRELSRAQVATSNLTNTQNLYEVWKETIDQKKAAESKPAEPETPKSTLGYSNLSDPSDFFKAAQNETLFKLNKNNFGTNLRDLKSLYDSSVNFKEKRNCRNTADVYLNLYNNGIENSFGDPDSSEEEDYEVRKKYWYGFLNVLLTIKSNLRKCVANKISFDDDVANPIASISNIWEINMFDNKTSRKDKEAMALAKQNLATEQSVIRKKLIEYKEMKTLKESVRNKILLTKENKDKKVNKISENLYKIAGDFYNDRYDVFFNKYVKLKESYKKSKMFLMEGDSDNFKNAFVRVFKGDEEELVRVAIPWFTSKLGLEGTVKTEVEEKLKNKYSGDAIADLFEDDWSDIVVLSIINNAKSDVSEPTNAMDAVEKALMSNMRADFKEDLKNSIKNLIYPVQDSRKTEIVNLANELKNAILASKDGEESQDDTDSKVDDIFS